MRRRRGYVTLGAVVALTGILNVAAWKSTAFCDTYVAHIYPWIVDTYGRMTGWVPFSVGEVMIVAGLILTAATALSGLAAVIFLLAGKRIGKWCGRLCRGYAYILAGVFVVMTLNCFIPYHCSPLEERFTFMGGGEMPELPADGTTFAVLPELLPDGTASAVLPELLPDGAAVTAMALSCEGMETATAVDCRSGQASRQSYTLKELEQLRDFIVIKANTLAEQVERDESGAIIYPENMDELAAEAMRGLSGDCPQLSGYYPRAKEIASSGFLSQQHMKGYFFPFSMEANYNKLMHSVNRPATICHEYAHLKGFMFEDEANLIGFLACIGSPDPVFQYSGYLSVLNYVNNDYYDAIGRNRELYAARVKISPQVQAENVFLQKKTWEKVEKKAVLKTEVINKVSDQLSQTSMVLNGVTDGILSYTRVVGLLISYYDGSPELEQTLFGSEYLVQSEMVSPTGQ